MNTERILVIRFGALGDLVMCRQAFADIRAAHPQAEIALLVAPAFAGFVQHMPWFDRIIPAERAPFWHIHKWLALLTTLYRMRPTRVYDLQGKFRQNVLFWLLGGPLWGPEWSGAAQCCSHPRLWPPAPDMHFVDFLAAQLRRAHVPPAPPANMDWLSAPCDDLWRTPQEAPNGIPAFAGMTVKADNEGIKNFALLIPGCSPQLLHKRWPVERYAELARRLKAERGLDSIMVGTKTEAETLAEIHRLNPAIINLCGQTSLAQLATLARHAACVVGNDTGPVHLAAAVGAPTLAVLSHHTNPVWSRPYGARGGWVKATPIENVTVDEVFVALNSL